jgi:hypothetical protein
MKYTVLWPNGEVVTGASYEELEDAVRATQWSTYDSREEFRNEMLTRAKVWSGKVVLNVKTSEELILGLRDVNMFMLFTEDAGVHA